MNVVATSVDPKAQGDRLFLPHEARDVGSLRESGLDASQIKALSSCAAWTETYPVQRVKKHRRRVEAICPMVGPSIAADAMHFTVDQVGTDASLEAIDALLLRRAETFARIKTDADPRLRCLVVVIPDVQGQRLLDATSPERTLKNELLRKGILVGEFFPTCPFATTFNPQLLALRSPAPMFVLRPFLDSDWRFICRVPDWQETYRERFGDPPDHLRHLGGFWWRMAEKIRWRLGRLTRRRGDEEESRSL